MTKGFYLVGEFDKGRKAAFMLLSQKEKPFDIDSVRGEIEPRVILGFKRNFVVYEFEFIEGHNLSEIKRIENTEEYDALGEEINEHWKRWCEKYKRKYSPIYTKQ